MGSFKTEDLGELVIQLTKCVQLLITYNRVGTKLQELGKEWVLFFLSSKLILTVLIVSRERPLVDGVVVVGKFLRYSRLVTRKSQLIQIGSVLEIACCSLVYSSSIAKINLTDLVVLRYSMAINYYTALNLTKVTENL